MEASLVYRIDVTFQLPYELRRSANQRYTKPRKKRITLISTKTENSHRSVFEGCLAIMPQCLHSGISDIPIVTKYCNRVIDTIVPRELVHQHQYNIDIQR